MNISSCYWQLFIDYWTHVEYIAHLIPNAITKKQSFSEVEDKDGKSGGINLNGNLHCTHCVRWKATTTLDGDHDWFLEEKQLTNFQCLEEDTLEDLVRVFSSQYQAPKQN